MIQFFLGTHVLKHLERTDVPLFVSRRTFAKRKSSLQPLGEWALDSGGFTELSMFGKWTISANEYIEELKRISRSPGLLWAAPQDYMCEPFIVEKTGLSVHEHQRRTVNNLIHLRSLNPPVHIIPVLQGFTLDEYKECFEMYESRGIDLREEAVVGLGSVCRRQSTNEIERIVSFFHSKDLRLHGFGVKITGLKLYGEMLESADSMAWSLGARLSKSHCSIHSPAPTTKNCANCLTYALEWREKVLS